MNFIDLSHPINEQMPVYPGGKKPVLKRLSDINKNGYRETGLTFHSHLGTHIDAPAHMLKDGKYLNQFPVSKFTGKAVIIEVPNGTKTISVEYLSQFNDDFDNSEFVLFYTGWGKYWKNERYFKDFPVLDMEAVNFLTSFNIKGVGVDAPSVDPVETKSWEVHYHLMKKDFIIIENL
ncbi:MAG: cyclase family protein, partial [Mariniphaga sp.]|nr:cyclase family protein [Mariniphaga sp.]